NRVFSKLASVTQTSHEAGQQPKSLPPVQFSYSKAVIDETVHEVDAESLQNLPYGLDGRHYEWADIDGEGASGILTEQGGGWFYKRNLSPLTPANGPNAPHARAKFSAEELLAMQPAPITAGARKLLLDLGGDGQLDLASFAGPDAGFYKRTEDETWESLT